MFRLIMGAVLKVGQNKLQVDDIKVALKSGEDIKLSAVMPSNGLYLNKVTYEE